MGEDGGLNGKKGLPNFLNRHGLLSKRDPVLQMPSQGKREVTNGDMCPDTGGFKMIDRPHFKSVFVEPERVFNNPKSVIPGEQLGW